MQATRFIEQNGRRNNRYVKSKRLNKIEMEKTSKKIISKSISFRDQTTKMKSTFWKIIYLDKVLIIDVWFSEKNN